MAHFKKNNRFTKSARPSFDGPRRDFGAPREMFDAECSNCHKMTQVPFRPNGTKPVFCRDCFKPEGDRAPHDRFPKKDFGPRREFAPRPQRDERIDALMREVGEMRAMLERVTNAVEKMERARALSAQVEETMKSAKAPKKPAKKAAKKKK